MGTVLSFANRTLGNGQWTASERSRLEALTERFFGPSENIQVVFGATDDGAPWCALTNEDDEVVVHVARLADQFLVHFVAEDVMASGANLREALGQWLSPEPERGGVVVPFSRAHSGAGVLVLLAVATFLEDQLRLVAPHLADGGAAPAVGLSDAETATPSEPGATDEAKGGAGPSAEDPSSDSDGSDAATASALIEAGEDRATSAAQSAGSATLAPPADPVKSESQASPPKDTPPELRGGDGDDRLIGSPRAERLVGGPGNDLLVGGGGRDTLDGGLGNDRIVLNSDSVAHGGRGGDTFVIIAPRVLNQPDTLLGTIFDFNASEGDRLTTAEGELVFVGRPGGEPSDLGFASTPDGGQRVEVDLDGDGRADGYVLLAQASPDVVMQGDGGVLMGSSPDWTGIFG